MGADVGGAMLGGIIGGAYALAAYGATPPACCADNGGAEKWDGSGNCNGAGAGTPIC